jgi:hypothetical protein
MISVLHRVLLERLNEKGKSELDMEKKLIRKPHVKGQFIMNILTFFTHHNKHDFYFYL